MYKNKFVAKKKKNKKYSISYRRCHENVNVRLKINRNAFESRDSKNIRDPNEQVLVGGRMSFSNVNLRWTNALDSAMKTKQYNLHRTANKLRHKTPTSQHSTAQHHNIQQLNIQHHNIQQLNIQHHNIHHHNIQKLNIQHLNIQQLNIQHHNIQHHNIQQLNIQHHNIHHHNIQKLNIQHLNIQQLNIQHLNIQHHNIQQLNIQHHNIIEISADGKTDTKMRNNFDSKSFWNLKNEKCCF